MESTRITLARALQLGVSVSWREAVAIVHGAIAATRVTEGAGPATVTAESCVLTRGGDVLLEGTAAQARPEVVVRLLDDLLASCSAPGRFADAVADGTALAMVEELSEHTTPRRRRVEVAAVALRGLAAAAAAARAMADAAARTPPAESVDAARDAAARQHDAATAAMGISPAQGRRPGLTPRPASSSVDVRRAPSEVTAVPPARDVRGGHLSFAWVKRASLAAAAVALFALTVAGILAVRTPATRRSAGEPSAPAFEPVLTVASVGLAGHDPLTRPARAPANPPSAAPGMARSAPRPLPSVEGRRGRAIPVGNTATAAGFRSRSTAVPTAGALAPQAAISAATPPPVGLSPVDGVPNATAAAPVETSRPAEPPGLAFTEVPANTPTPPRSPDAEARAIESVLGRYRTAFNRLDAGAALAVWPTANEKALARAFARLQSHDVSFENCQIEVVAGRAEAACRGHARYVPKVGGQTARAEALRWRFRLRKASGEWLIDAVDAR